ncbi:MAG: SLC13 family permease [Gallintestinimicrobium sp.]
MANEIGSLVTKFARTERGLIVAIMVIVGMMSGFLSNTGTAAVLIPVVIGIAAKSGYKRSRLLMPLVFAAAMGGNLSLIGGFLFYATVGFKILPNHDTVDIRKIPFLMNQRISVRSRSGKKCCPWSFWLFTMIGMILKKELGIKLFVLLGRVGAVLLLLTGALFPEKDALKSIDLKTIFFIRGTLFRWQRRWRLREQGN